MFGPITRKGPDRFRLRLSADERTTVAAFVEQLHGLLIAEDPSSDPAVARLFPAAYPEDVLANLEFERTHGDDLLKGKLAALDTMQATLQRNELTEEETLAWLGSLNTLRLVIGTRLDIREESTAADFAGDEVAAGSFELYSYLTWLQGWVIDALAEGPNSSAAQPG